MRQRTFVLDTPYASLTFAAESRAHALLQLRDAGIRPGGIYTLTEIEAEIADAPPSWFARLLRRLGLAAEVAR